MEQRPSWEVSSHSASQEFLAFSGNWTFITMFVWSAAEPYPEPDNPVLTCYESNVYFSYCSGWERMSTSNSSSYRCRQ
jgi:hypothetical protein